jgi:hypothetical protein
VRFVSAGCLTLVALAACSDSPVSPNDQQQILVHLANALAHGAIPAVVTMTMAGRPSDARPRAALGR